MRQQLKRLPGNVTINNGGTWNETAASAVTFGGNLQNDGSLTASTGTHTFSGSANKTFSGANAIDIPNVTFTNSYTNNGTLTISTGLNGSGGGTTLTNGVNATLNIGDASFTAPNLTTTANGNTVNYNRAGNQTVKAETYFHLILSGSGTKTTENNVSVNGNLSIKDGTTFAIATGDDLTVSGTTTIGEGASGTISFLDNNSVIRFDGLVTIAANGTWSNATNNNPINIRGGITNNGTFSAGTGLYTFNTSAAQTLEGTFSIPNVTVNSPTVLTNTNTLTVGTALSGTGTLVNSETGTLNIGGTSLVLQD